MDSTRPSKPLPSLPASERALEEVHRLTEASYGHLATTLRYALQAEALDQSWAELITAALNDMADSISRGRWLHGLKLVRATAAAVVTERERKRRLSAREDRLKAAQEDIKTPAKPPVPDKDPVELGEHRRRARDDLIRLTSSSNVPAPIGTPKHLLLVAAPLGPIVPAEDFDFDLVPNSRSCSFASGNFAIPALNAKSPDTAGHFLYGLDNWNPDISAQFATEGHALRLVGGTFKFAGVSSPEIYVSLVKVLRISIYVRLALLLEQRLIFGFHVPLKFRKLPSPLNSPALSTVESPTSQLVAEPPAVSPQSTVSQKRLSRAAAGFRSAASSGIWSFISKRTEGILHGPRHSLSLRSGYSSDGWNSPKRPSIDLSATQRPERHSEDDGAEGIETLRSPRAAPRHAAGKFSLALKHLEETVPALSTSPDMEVPLPRLLSKLAAREEAILRGGRRKPRLLLTGDERTALEDLRGWNETDPFQFDDAFTGFQQFTALYSEHVPTPPRICDNDKIFGLTRCGAQRWITHRFWSTPLGGALSEDTLGGNIERICDLSAVHCDICDVPRKLHTSTWNHENVKVTITVDYTNGRSVPEMQMWESCAVCSARNPALPVDDAVYMYSFSKFIELLAYSRTFRTIAMSLCQHTTPQDASDGQTAVADRHNILRHFSRDGQIVTFTTATVVAVYDIRVPRMQIIHEPNFDRRDFDMTATNTDLEPEQEDVRLEIRKWWDGLRGHLQELKDYFEDELDTLLSVRPPATLDLSGKGSSPGPSTAGSTELITGFNSDTSLNSSTTLQTLSSTSQLTDGATLKTLLAAVIRETEQELYSMLRSTPVSSLNDVRRAFSSSARGIIKRLAAWQAKHAPAAASEPDWWKSGCYAVPGGRVVVRDGEWGSIISCALSSSDYSRELSNMQAGRPSSFASHPDTTHDSRPSTPASSVSQSTGTTVRPKKPIINKPLPDPDDESARESWHEPEPFQTTTSRIDHTRDRSVDSATTNTATTGGIGSRFSSLGSSASRFITTISAPASAWAKPAVDVSLGQAEGKLVGDSTLASGDAEQALLKVVEHQLMVSATEEDHSLNASSFVDVQSPNLPRSTVDPSASLEPGHIRTSSAATIVPPVPPKDLPLVQTPAELTSNPLEYTEATKTDAKEAVAAHLSLTSTLANAMRFVLNTAGGSETPSTGRRGLLHPLLGAREILAQDIEDMTNPHIKYDFVLGSRLRFSCTVYYARQFDQLRRRCGIGEDMIQSLARTAGWNAAGGKSKANFWKTTDNRFVIKSLVNAWNVADLQVLNETAPAYFKYLDDSANRASVIAKLLGYFTVEIKNVETNTTHAKADLLVMENLFFKQTITRTFDLKGIQGRRVKAKAREENPGATKTLFDGEWIEDQQKALVLLQPHSKRVLQEAVKSDAEFLARSNIMDYSLLLGIDEGSKEIACGLVDTIGSYSFAKTLEYKAKQGLNNNLITSSQKEVTVIPPTEYRDRFVKSIDTYFLACPDKWTKLNDDETCEQSQLYNVL
ncbi:hypothetical protein BKA62DRAFT_742949 [Auriculariales sp. MPI-PUGE-AT-0066]|nr:hypothetical protein BKA62DRAFT_742949 [Auriculariales sp. MPI-PUGE-AT-0066]